jgi:hypothetical protein
MHRVSSHKTAPGAVKQVTEKEPHSTSIPSGVTFWSGFRPCSDPEKCHAIESLARISACYGRPLMSISKPAPEFPTLLIRASSKSADWLWAGNL